MSQVSELARRLSALRGELAPIASVPQPASAEDDEWTARVARLRAAVRMRERSRTSNERAPLPGIEIAPGLLETSQRFVPFARLTPGGLSRRDLAMRLDPKPPSYAPLQPDWHQGAPVPVQCLLGLDTETTGLSGGVGTRVFMLGLTRLETQGWTTRQLLLTKPSATAALHERLCELIPEGATLLTYNGKRFDLPLLNNAAVLSGKRDPLPGMPHWDLLYPVRRRYRKLWPNCRLLTLEQQLLGYFRSDDLPGSEAPAAWRRYLQSGETTPLLRVLEHNREDLVTLVEAVLRLCDIPEASTRSSSNPSQP